MSKTRYSDIFIVEADGEEVEKWPTAHKDRLLESVKRYGRTHDLVSVYGLYIKSKEPDVSLGSGQWRQGTAEYGNDGMPEVVVLNGEVTYDAIDLFKGEKMIGDEVKINGTTLNDNQIRLIRLMLDLFDNDYDETRFTNEEVEEMVYKIKRLFIMK